MPQHALIVKFDYGATTLDPLYALEDLLSETLSEVREGECDGHDITPDLRKATVYLYGPDAEFLFVATQPVFENAECVQNAVATLRFGPPEDGVAERVVRMTRRFGEPGQSLRPW